VYRDEGTEILQNRECSARGRDEGTESREYRVESTEYSARMQLREYRVESTEYSARVHRDESTETIDESRVQECKSTARE